jgi:heme-degrading monooxygenase HmoA
VVVETTTFKLAAGASAEQFLEADRDVQCRFFPNLPGFLRRTTCSSSDGEWLVVTIWESESDALSSAQLASSSEPARHLASLVDRATVRHKRYLTLD